MSEDEERRLVAVFEELDFGEVRMRGQTARRTVVHFGYRYDYEGWRLTPADPLPEALAGLRERAGTLVDIDSEQFAETLVTRYPTGAGIGWHRDAPLFGPNAVGVSLLTGVRCASSAALPPSGRRMPWTSNRGPRTPSPGGSMVWQHSIPATAGLRYSVTFRTLARPGAGDPPVVEGGPEGADRGLRVVHQPSTNGMQAPSAPRQGPRPAPPSHRRD